MNQIKHVTYGHFLFGRTQILRNDQVTIFFFETKCSFVMLVFVGMWCYKHEHNESICLELSKSSHMFIMYHYIYIVEKKNDNNHNNFIWYVVQTAKSSCIRRGLKNRYFVVFFYSTTFAHRMMRWISIYNYLL